MRIAAAYIRVSTDDQAEYSPDAQLRALKKYAEEHDMVMPSQYVYVDEGISGRSAQKRPAFMAMIAQAKADKPFEVILVHKFDRFARSREDSIVYKNLLKRECGVSVISISESIDDGGSGMGMLIESISEAYAEFYSVNLGREVKKGMSEKALRGELQSTPSFGYEAKDGKLVPRPEEADIVRSIFSWFLAGAGYSAIAKKLNAQGVRTHRGNLFENRTVEYILRNPVYVGKLRWTPTGRSRRDFANPDTIIADSTHEPLIDAQTWAAAQRRVAEVKAQWGYKARPSYELKDWLSGCVRCSSCGATLVFLHPRYMRCSNYARGRCLKTQHITVDALHEAVISRLTSDFSGAAPLSVQIDASTSAQATQIAALTKRKKDVSRRLERLRAAYLDGLEDMDTYRRLKTQIESELAQIDKEISDAETLCSPASADAAMRARIAEALATLTSANATITEKNNAFRSVVERCIFNRDAHTLDIVYRYFA